MLIYIYICILYILYVYTYIRIYNIVYPPVIPRCQWNITLSNKLRRRFPESFPGQTGDLLVRSAGRRGGGQDRAGRKGEGCREDQRREDQGSRAGDGSCGSCVDPGDGWWVDFEKLLWFLGLSMVITSGFYVSKKRWRDPAFCSWVNQGTKWWIFPFSIVFCMEIPAFCSWVTELSTGPWLPVRSGCKRSLCWPSRSNVPSGAAGDFSENGGHMGIIIIHQHHIWITLWWTNILPWKITIFNGKIHYFYGHFPWQNVSSPEGILIINIGFSDYSHVEWV